MSNSLFIDPKTEKWLDVGCGEDKISGATGIDIIGLEGVDIEHDLNNFPWPFNDNHFNHIVCNHSISHLENIIKTIEELHRICKPDGIIEILAPHYASDNCNTDPTTKVRIGIRSMNYFIEEFRFKYKYYSSARFQLVKRYISFRENRTDYRQKVKSNPFKWLGIEFVINLFPRIYERFFVYWIPPSEVYFKLKVKK